MNWQTIETAPKDGTPILGYWVGEGESADYPYFYALAVYEAGSWRGAEYRRDEYGDPDFWMPLPTPPARGAKDDRNG